MSFSVGGFHQICSGFVFHQLFGHFPGVLEEEVDALDFAHNVLGLAEAEPDESQAWTWTQTWWWGGMQGGPQSDQL